MFRVITTSIKTNDKDGYYIDRILLFKRQKMMGAKEREKITDKTAPQSNDESCSLSSITSAGDKGGNEVVSEFNFKNLMHYSEQDTKSLRRTRNSSPAT